MKLKINHPFINQKYIRGYISELRISAKEHGNRVWAMGGVCGIRVGGMAWHGMLRGRR